MKTEIARVENALKVQDDHRSSLRARYQALVDRINKNFEMLSESDMSRIEDDVDKRFVLSLAHS